MNPWPECKSTKKEENIGVILATLAYLKISEIIRKAQAINEKVDKLGLIKIKTFAVQKIPIRKRKDKPQNGRNYS